MKCYTRGDVSKLATSILPRRRALICLKPAAMKHNITTHKPLQMWISLRKLCIICAICSSKLHLSICICQNCTVDCPAQQ